MNVDHPMKTTPQPKTTIEEEATSIETHEAIDLVKLRKLLSFTKKKDPVSFRSLSFYYECYADRHEQSQTEIQVQYLPSKRMREYKLGRTYANVSSFFVADSTRYGGLQTMKKGYRSYLCEHLYFDVDLVNAHPSILYGLLLKVGVTPPDLLRDYVYARDSLLAKIIQLFGLDDTQKPLAKKLMLRLMYGGTIQSWMTEFKIAQVMTDIEDSELLLRKFERFPAMLSEVSCTLRTMPDFAAIRHAFESTCEKEKPKMASFLSLLLEELEKQILMAADSYLANTYDRRFEVLIHDGGLIRRRGPKETELPPQILAELNSAIQEQFDMKVIKFIAKPFDLSLKDAINKEPQLYLQFGYPKWKYYLEEHRDLCYFSKDKCFLFADNKQTHFYKREDLRTAMAEYCVYANTVLPHQQGVESLDEEDQEKDEKQAEQESIPIITVDDELQEQEEEQATNRVVKNSISKKNKKAYFIDLWLKDPTKKRFDMIYFSEKTALRDNSVTFVTPIDHRKKFTPINRYIFQGWDLMQEPVDPRSSPQPFLDFVAKIFPSKVVYDYVLNWIAHIFQCPDERLTGTCLCILSRIQGSGKSTLMEVLLNLLGRYGMKINNPKQQLFDNFTHAMEHHLLLAIDDSDSSALREKVEDFKNLITSDDARIRELYSPERTIFSNVRFLLISNNTSVINLEEGSRRFSVLEPSNELVGDHVFFQTFRNEYWASLANRRATLNYLLNEHKIPKYWHPEASYPVSVLKKKMEAANLNPLSCFLYSLSSTVVEQFQEKKQQQAHYDFLDVQSTELRNQFTAWFNASTTSHNNFHTNSDKKSKNSNHNTPSRNEFPMELDKLGVINTRDLPPGPDKKWYKNGQWYRIPLLAFARKADEYELEPLDAKFCVKGEFITKSDSASQLRENLTASQSSKRKCIIDSSSNSKTSTSKTTPWDKKFQRQSPVVVDSEKERSNNNQEEGEKSQDSEGWQQFMKTARHYRDFEKEIKKGLLADFEQLMEKKLHQNLVLLQPSTIIHKTSTTTIHNYNLAVPKPAHDIINDEGDDGDQLESKSQTKKRVKK